MTATRQLALTTLLLAAIGGSHAASAQVAGKPLPVQATVAWTITHSGTPPGVDGWQPSFSWTGRLALRLKAPLYLGFTAEGWGQDVGSQAGDDGNYLLTSSASAMTWLGYVQYYPLRQSVGFVRGGAGWSYTYTSVPAGPYIENTRKVRFAWTVGGGADIRIRRPVYFTPALDYTALVDVPEGSALDHGLTLSLGLTIR